MLDFCNQYLRSISSRQQACLKSIFKQWGHLVYTHPFAIIALSFMCLLISLYGLSYYKENSNWKDLWVPEDSEGMENYREVQEIYEGQITSFEIVLVPRSESQDAISLEVFELILEFDSLFKANANLKGVYYEDLCYRIRPNEGCQTKGHPLDFFLTPQGNYNISVSSDSELLEKIRTGKGHPDLYPEWSPKYISIEEMFGGTVPSSVTINGDGSNNIESARAIKWSYYMKQNATNESFLYDFEKSLQSFIVEFTDSTEIAEIHIVSLSLIDEALEKSADVNGLLMITVILILTYSFIALGNTNSRQSRMFCSIIGLVNVGIAYIECLAIGALLGVEGNLSIGALPFVMLGIGVDDMFILMTELDQAPSQYSSYQKFIFMMKHAGLSISITSLTNMCSFLSGSLTSIVSLRNFCIYGAIGMFFDYFNQISFFCAVVALDLRRSDKGKGDFCGLVSCSPTSAICCHGKWAYDENGNPRESFLVQFFRDVYGPLIFKPACKIISLTVYVLVFIFLFIKVSQINFDLTPEQAVSEDFVVKKGLDLNMEYFSNTDYALFFFTTHSDFSSYEEQQRIRNLENSIRQCEGCSKDWMIPSSTISWHTFFSFWVARGQCEGVTLINGYVPTEDFYDCLKLWQETHESDPFIAMMAWNSNQTELEAAAIITGVKRQMGAENEMQQVLDMRQIAKEGPEGTFPYNLSFLWYEQFFVFKKETALCLGSSIAVVFTIVLLMISDILGAFLVFFMVLLTLVGQIAVLCMCDESLNIATISVTVMSIGIAVDYNVHFYYAYLSNKRNLIKAFELVAAGIFHGAVTTVIALIPLLFDRSFIVSIFVKGWISIIIFSLTNALLIIPILLSILKKETNEKGPIELQFINN